MRKIGRGVRVRITRPDFSQPSSRFAVVYQSFCSFPDSTRRGNKWKRGHNDSCVFSSVAFFPQLRFFLEPRRNEGRSVRKRAVKKIREQSFLIAKKNIA